MREISQPGYGQYVTQHELEAALENLWVYVLQLNGQVTILGEKQMAVQADVDALTAQVTTLDGQVNSLDAQLKAQDASVQASITAITAEITALQNANPSLDLSGLQDAVAQLATDEGTAGSDDTQLGTDVAAVAAIPPAPAG